MQGKIHSLGNEFSNFLKTTNDNFFLFQSADSLEILLIIDSFDNNKSSGPNSIPTDVLKLIKNNICHPLKEIINLSFSTGIYPTQLKLAKVIPTFKDPLLVSNYRPISLLSNVNKIFERIVHKRIYSFLNKYNCIYEQFGFRAQHSTNHALLSFTEKIREAMDNKGGKFACGVFIDLQKAFGTIDHSILLKKFKHYGIRGLANQWFKSYLPSRTQFASVNGYVSATRDMKYGVPQGSVLGPLIFLMYIDDLHNAIKFSTVHHFADNTNLLVSNSCINGCKCKWLKANKISLNASKNKILIFRHQNKPIMYRKKPEDKLSMWNINIKIDGKKIEPSSHVKYLGILIDSFLNWNFHIDELSIKHFLYSWYARQNFNKMARTKTNCS